MERPQALGLLVLMVFCGSGPILAGPWPLTSRINIGQDSSFKDLADGVYEICFCSPAQVGDSMVSCTDGKDFGYLRGLLSLHHGHPHSLRHPTLPEVTLQPLPGAASKGSSLFILPHWNEISQEVVYCRVGNHGQIDSTCRFTLQITDSAERSVALSFVPVHMLMDSSVLCTFPGATMNATVKGVTEIQVLSFVPSSIKYAICADGSLLGTLITSGKFMKVSALIRRKGGTGSPGMLLFCRRGCLCTCFFLCTSLVLRAAKVNSGANFQNGGS